MSAGNFDEANFFVVKTEACKSEFSENLESDVTLIVENQKLHVHSAILTMVSPVFKKMLSGEVGTKQLVLKEKKLEDVLLMLKAIYPQFQPSLIGQLQIQQLKILASFSREYNMESLKTFVEKQAYHLIIVASQRENLVQEDLDLKSLLFSVLSLAEQENMKELIGMCIEYIAILTQGCMGDSENGIKNLYLEDLEILSGPTRVKLCIRMMKEAIEHRPTSPMSHLEATVDFMSKAEL